MHRPERHSHRVLPHATGEAGCKQRDHQSGPMADAVRDIFPACLLPPVYCVYRRCQTLWVNGSVMGSIIHRPIDTQGRGIGSPDPEEHCPLRSEEAGALEHGDGSLAIVAVTPFSSFHRRIAKDSPCLDSLLSCVCSLSAGLRHS